MQSDRIRLQGTGGWPEAIYNMLVDMISDIKPTHQDFNSVNFKVGVYEKGTSVVTAYPH